MQYIHEWSQLVISQTTIDAAIYDFPELVDYSKYAYQLSPYLEEFSRDKILPVFFERMFQSPNWN